MEDKNRRLVYRVIIFVIGIYFLIDLIPLLISGDLSFSFSPGLTKRIVLLTVVLSGALGLFGLANFPETSFKRLVLVTGIAALLIFISVSFIAALYVDK